MNEKENTTVKILLVDDHPIIRKGIKQVVENIDQFTVNGEASNASEAMNHINKINVMLRLLILYSAEI